MAQNEKYEWGDDLNDYESDVNQALFYLARSAFEEVEDKKRDVMLRMDYIDRAYYIPMPRAEELARKRESPFDYHVFQEMLEDVNEWETKTGDQLVFASSELCGAEYKLERAREGSSSSNTTSTNRMLSILNRSLKF